MSCVSAYQPCTQSQANTLPHQTFTRAGSKTCGATASCVQDFYAVSGSLTRSTATAMSKSRDTLGEQALALRLEHIEGERSRVGAEHRVHVDDATWTGTCSHAAMCSHTHTHTLRISTVNPLSCTPKNLSSVSARNLILWPLARKICTCLLKYRPTCTHTITIHRHTHTPAIQIHAMKHRHTHAIQIHTRPSRSTCLHTYLCMHVLACKLVHHMYYSI